MSDRHGGWASWGEWLGAIAVELPATLSTGNVLVQGDVEPFSGVVRQVVLMGSVGVNEGVSRYDCDGGDADAAVLFREHGPGLRRIARAITFDANLAEEVVQDAFVGLLRLDGGVDNPPAYLHRSVVNGAVDRVRRRERFRLLPERRAPDIAETEVDELWPMIARLPPQQRALIALRFYEDQTYEQIGETLDMPIGSVKSGLHRALKNLREQL